MKYIKDVKTKRKLLQNTSTKTYLTFSLVKNRIALSNNILRTKLNIWYTLHFLHIDGHRKYGRKFYKKTQ